MECGGSEVGCCSLCQALADQDFKWNAMVRMLDAVAYVRLWQMEIIGGM